MESLREDGEQGQPCAHIVGEVLDIGAHVAGVEIALPRIAAAHHHGTVGHLLLEGRAACRSR